MTLQITVPLELHEAIAAACGPTFAASYLSGAVVSNQQLLPWTQMAWSRLKDNRPAMSVLARAKITLVKPPRFGEGQPQQGEARC